LSGLFGASGDGGPFAAIDQDGGTMLKARISRRGVPE
jgi:hypothetical protein